MDGGLRLPGETIGALAARIGGRVAAGPDRAPTRVASIERAQAGELAPLLSRRHVKAAREAAARGALLLVDASLESALGVAAAADAIWFHEFGTWALADVLDGAIAPETAPVLGEGCRVAPTAILGPRVVLGERVTVGPGAVIGHPGFGWAFGKDGAVRPVPQLGGVVLEDDVSIGPLSTVDAGTLAPTFVGRGAKLDAHVHVGHNGRIGEGTIIAAQSGFAGSVTIGRGVLIGGQVGIADHLVIGDGARIAAKTGVIGDVPAGATVAGYPAVPRVRWLRALARVYRGLERL
ncbi:MAG TPA: UDP-3-O-(3-hydroxymyristoyl)glucosamine N-acyltransferase [Polyangiaceae bacterium]|jgi:UDP-3-O-[3-hydroxymyristoyl] glucosamine N-acyltransferase|nr:UDP-3-O-(3-hydroxymyristoyl)glucosamine N-acyltransferase [Polyangiaceae bacterium]